MKQSLASAPPATWNLKNEPSGADQFMESPGPGSEVITQLPSAALGFARRRPGVLLVSLLAIGVLGLVWYVAGKD